MHKLRPAFLGLCVAAGLGLAPNALSRSETGPKPVKVSVIVYGHPNDNPQFSGKIVCAPHVVHAGTPLLFEIKNLDNEFHDIEINGMTSRRMGHNGRAVMRVTFKKPGTYIVSAPDDNASGISGTIKVVA